MSPGLEDFWNQVEELLHEALRRSPQEQARFVAVIADPAVRAEVESLLDAAKNRPDLNIAESIGKAAGALVAEAGVNPPGRTLGHFELLRRIGVGGMSEVHLARDLDLGRAVALKLLPAALGRDSERSRRFRQEARAASALNHPNIVTIFEIGEADGQLHIAMEYVEGEPLRQRLGRGPLTIAETLAVAEQTASALQAAHAAGVVHRDIKPDNIMLRPDGMVKILDFGLARINLDPETDPIRTLPGSLIGTPLYMSPEQARCLPLDARTDLWSLGAILYEMLTGAAAFRGDSTADILVSILESQPSRPSARNPETPAELDDLTLSLLAKDPGRRPASAALVVNQLQRLRERYTSDVRRPLALPRQTPANLSTGAKWARWASRRKAGIAAGVLLIALGAFLAPRTIREKAVTLRQFTSNLEENRLTAAAISPDGRHLAYAELNGPLVLRGITASELRAFPLPKGLAVTQIAWYPNGLDLLLSAESEPDRTPGLWKVSLSQNPPRLLRANAKLGAPSPDGSAIAFTSGDQSEILIMDSAGQHVRRLIVGGRTDTFPLLLWSPDGRRLSYQRRHYAPRAEVQSQIAESENDYQRSYECIRVDSGERLAAQPNLPMMAACETASGRILFVRPDKPQNPFSRNVWEVQTDLKTGAFTAPPRRLTSQQETSIVGMSCSADGNVAGVLSPIGLSNIYIGDIHQPGPQLTGIRRLTLNERPQYPHAWTADGQAVLFELGDIHGAWDIYMQRLDERLAIPLATGPTSEITPQLSPDGNWVMYCDYDAAGPKGLAAQKLMRVPLRGGAPVEVPAPGGFDEFRCALTAGKRCVLRTVENGQLLYSELDPIRGRGRELARTAWVPTVLGDWALSADGTKVAIPNHDAREARIHILALDPPPGAPESWDIPIRGLSRLRGVYWASDDLGWFASLDTSTGVALAYVDNTGASRVLRESPIITWGVPSPDGQHLAFVDWTLFSNFWLLDRR